MECTSASGLSQPGIEYTEKQKKLIESCDSVISKEGIELGINEPCGALPDNLTVALDIEHDEQGNMVGIGICTGSRCDYYTELSSRLVTKLGSFSYIMHNGVSDIECLRMWGINVRDDQLIHDTMLIGHLLDSSLKSYGLKDMAKRELGIEYPDYEVIVGKHKGKTKKSPKCPQIEHDCCGRITLDKQPIELTSKYNCLDCYVTYRLYECQKKTMKL